MTRWGIGRKPIVHRKAPAAEVCNDCKRMWDPRALKIVHIYRSSHPGSFKVLCPDCRELRGKS